MNKLFGFLLSLLLIISTTTTTVIHAQPAYFVDPCAITTFGADGTDEIEDTDQIQAAAIACGGQQIRVPPGRYIYDEDIPTFANTAWQGAGNAISILQYKGGLTGMTPPFPKFTRWTTDAGFGTPISNLSYRDLGFDMNGNDWNFGGMISIEKGTNILIENCRFFDSDAPLKTETAGTGDGVQTTFTYTLNTIGDSQPLSRTVTVTDGTQVATDDGEGGFVGDVSSPGSMTYNRQGALTVNFTTAPSNGTPVVVTYRSVVQRQYIALLSSTNVRVINNTLTHGGRIFAGRTGSETFINGNVVEDANDNAITISNAANHVSRRVEIIGNMVRNPSTAGIYYGADGAQPGVVLDQIIIANNTITGSFDNSGILGRLGTNVLGGVSLVGNNIKSTGNQQANHGISITEAGEGGLTGGKHVIQGNRIDGSYSTTAMSIVLTQKMLVSGNLINLTSTGTVAFWITASSDTTVSNNEVYGAAQALRFVAGSGSAYSGILVRQNRFVYTGTGTNAGVAFDAGVTVAKSRIYDNYIEGPAYGIRNNSGNVLDLSIEDNNLTNNATAGFINASGSLAATATVTGLRVTHAQLAGLAVRDGSDVYCTDCTRAAPTASGGAGARLRREAGAWNGD